MGENNIESLLRALYEKLGRTPGATGATGKCLTDEEMACFLDGSFSRKELRPVNTHILSCRKCAESLREITEVLQQVEDGDLPVPDRLVSMARAMVLQKDFTQQ